MMEVVLPQTFHSMLFEEHINVLLEHEKFFDLLLKKKATQVF